VKIHSLAISSRLGILHRERIFPIHSSIRDSLVQILPLASSFARLTVPSSRQMSARLPASHRFVSGSLLNIGESRFRSSHITRWARKQAKICPLRFIEVTDGTGLDAGCFHGTERLLHIFQILIVVPQIFCSFIFCIGADQTRYIP